jgi:bis(5'-nucleosyl)-tetraphosphatase (symmetrical)
MYGNSPDQWDAGLQGPDRLRIIVNALTRLRFCTPEGRMDFDSTESAAQAPAGLVPWFDARTGARSTPDRLRPLVHAGLVRAARPAGPGHGCVWGGCLSAVRFGATLAEREQCKVQCTQAQRPANEAPKTKLPALSRPWFQANKYLKPACHQAQAAIF